MKASNETSSSTAQRAGRQAASGDSFSRTDDRFHLTGPSLDLDARVHAYRKDIADIALAGQIFAPHYARPFLRLCGPTAANVYLSGSTESEIVARLAPGDAFAVLEYAGGWAWGYVRDSHVVGYVEATLLVAPA